MSVSLPMTGSWTVLVHRINPYSIHGDSYYELVVERPQDPGKLMGLRASSHVLPQPPQVPFQAEIAFLMSQITAVRVLPSPPASPEH